METTRVNDPINLESVEQQFNNWRASRSNKRERIPRELWQAAVRLCDVHPVHQVSRSLRLSRSAIRALSLSKKNLFSSCSWKWALLVPSSGRWNVSVPMGAGCA